MSQIMVLIRDHEAGVYEMIDQVQALQRRQRITISDAAIVIRQADGKVKVRQANQLVGAGTLGGAFWGLFIGRLFWAPWASSEASEPASSRRLDCGLDDDFINEVWNSIRPGYSALLMMVMTMNDKGIEEAFLDHRVQIVSTQLSLDDELRLHDAFGVQELF
ncbi:MAG: DUF1269 domain-containing protein [Candidatus Promineifilaceae bacterium]|nr:DUF1269 domain-containing protein [Candidatus Promineifilaceae bacterium]